VTLKGQGRDPNALDAYYFENLQQLDIMPYKCKSVIITGHCQGQMSVMGA